MSAESSLVGELERRVGDQEEAVRCLMELVEDTLPTEHVRAPPCATRRGLGCLCCSASLLLPCWLSSRLGSHLRC